MSQLAVMGGGSWGTTLSVLLAGKGQGVSLWVREEDLAEEIRRTRVNGIFLPGLEIPESVLVSSKTEEVLAGARYIVSAVPTQFVRPVIRGALPHIPKEAVFLSVSKGIEKGTYLTASSIIKELTGCTVAVLSGPSFAKEVAMKLPTAVTLASEDYGVCLILQEIFTTGYFRVYTHQDVLGVELGGALKNIMAVASGISDGLGLGNNARAALITRGLAEMTRLGVALGAQENTFSGLSGLGDLVLTCSSNLSRNYTVGYRLGQGERLPGIISSTRSVAEGVETAKAVNELAKTKDVDMPIVEQVHMVLYDGKAPEKAVHDLMNRTLKAEFHG
jgi:glycerol-3-phosphate dehydrogenase (NAD(P)+)